MNESNEFLQAEHHKKHIALYVRVTIKSYEGIPEHLKHDLELDKFYQVEKFDIENSRIFKVKLFGIDKLYTSQIFNFYELKRIDPPSDRKLHHYDYHLNH